MTAIAHSFRTITGPSVELVTITPDMAKRWLENAGPNRNLSDFHVRRLESDMRSGQWAVNSETIKFDTDGRLLDGQHRLWACVLAEASFESFVAYNLPAEAQNTVDTGRNRSFAHVLQIGGQSNVSMMAGAARLWYGYDHGLLGGGNKIRASHRDLLTTVDAHPALKTAVEHYVSLPNMRKLGQPSALVFAYSGALERDAKGAREWFEALASGAGLESDNPAFLLRERLIAQRTQRPGQRRGEDTAAIAIKSWRAFAEGRAIHPNALRYMSNEKFPSFDD